MINLSEISEIGRFNKPHGIKGEISVTLDYDVDLADVRCIVVDVDGIFVPFFIESIRPKTADTSLVKLDGVDSEENVKPFVNKSIYILREDLPDFEDYPDDDDEGFYASDLIGYRMIDAVHGEIGTIVDINDSTENVLFIVKNESGDEIFVPVVDEFILSVEVDDKIVSTEIPEDLLTLN